MKPIFTPTHEQAIKKITDRLTAIDCKHRVQGGTIHLEWSMDDLQEIAKVDVYQLLDMDDLSEYFGSDWESPTRITVFVQQLD